jgi:septal ring factor EnvC (AmiA/AmiB activator)
MPNTPDQTAAAFIAEARNSLPLLLAELKRQEAELMDMREREVRKNAKIYNIEQDMASTKAQLNDLTTQLQEARAELEKLEKLEMIEASCCAANEEKAEHLAEALRKILSHQCKEHPPGQCPHPEDRLYWSVAREALKNTGMDE